MRTNCLGCVRSTAGSGVSTPSDMGQRAITLAFIALGGCAPLPYVEPTGEDTATLRIENQTAAVFGYELEADTYKDAATCAGRLRIADARALPRGVAHNVRVGAAAEFTLTFRGSGGGASRAESCAVAGTFTPVAGERYVAIFRSGQQKCELVFAHQQPGGARRYARESSYRERFDAACLGASAPSSIPAPASAQPPPPASGVPPAPPLPPR